MASKTSSLANQMKHRDREMVPRILVQAMFGLMLASLGLVTYAQLSGMPETGVVAESAIVTERSITLVGDRRDGYAVMDASGAQIAHSRQNKAGFIDVVANSIERERKVNGLSLDAPLTVARRENGRVAVIDPASGWTLELIGYGKDNVAAFAGLLD